MSSIFGTPGVGFPTRPLLAFLLALLLTLLPACSRDNTKPAPTSTSPRIVSLAPAFTQMLAAIGRADAIVARHAYDPWADALAGRTLPIVGDQAGIDYEALIAARPTHVLFQRLAGGTPDRLASLARANNWTLIDPPLLTLDEVESACRIVQTTFATPTSSTIALPLASRSTEPLFTGRVLILYQPSPPIVLGPGSYHHELLVRLGGNPAVTTGSPFMTLDAEDIRRNNPDAIILIKPRNPNTPAPSPAANLSTHFGILARLDLPAFKHNRLAVIDDETALIPGPNLRAVADRMKDALQAWHKTEEPSTPRAR